MLKLLRNTYVFSLITKSVMVFLGLATSVIINRYLGPTLKGEYSYYLNIINILVLIMNLGIYQSYPFFRRKYGDDVRDRYFSIMFFQAFIFMFLAIVVWLIIRNHQLLNVLLLSILMILVKQLGFIVLVENFFFRSINNMLTYTLYGLLLLVSYFFFDSNLTIVYGILYIRSVFSLLLIIIKFNIRFDIRKLDFRLMVDAIKFGVYPMLTSLLITLNYQADILILKLFKGFEEIGYYTVGVGLANQVWVIPDAFKEVLFSKTAKKDAIDEINLSMKINLYICIAVITVISIFGEWVIEILYGVAFLPSYTVTVTIFFGLIPMMYYKLISPLYVAKGKQKTTFLFLAISVFMNVVLNFIFIPLLGIFGAAISSVASYSLCGLLFVVSYIRLNKLGLADILIINKNEFHRIAAVIGRDKEHSS